MRREVVWFALLTLAVLVSLGPAACAIAKDETKATPTAPAATSIKTPRNAFNRTCDTSVYGTLDAPTWKKHSIIAGPLVFYYADQFAHQPPGPGRNGYYPGEKLLILVRRGTVATVVVPEPERGYVSLLYNPAAWNDRNAYKIEDGETAVRFKACKKGETAPAGGPLTAMTQFNGGFVVAGIHCVPLEVLTTGRAAAIGVTLSFGAGRCAS
jgi:hypothetical protein